MSAMIKKRSGNVSKAQKDALLYFLEQHPKLRSGKFDSTFTYKDAAKLWEKGSITFNAIPGSQKDFKNWRKCWHDIKNEVRSKASTVKKNFSGTGGGPSLHIPLTEYEERVRDFIGETCISGHEGVPESSVDVILIDPVVEQSDEEIVIETLDDFNQDESQVQLEVPEGNCTTAKQKEKPKRIRNVAAHRVQQTLNTAEEINKNIKRKMDFKEQYYAEKLKLLERKTVAHEKIAEALSKIANNLVN